MTNYADSARRLFATFGRVPEHQNCKEGQFIERIADAISEAVKAECERCAQIAEGEEFGNSMAYEGFTYMFRRLADRIRAQAPESVDTATKISSRTYQSGQAPSPAESLPPSEPSLPPLPDPSETIPEQVQNAAKSESYTPAGIDSEYARMLKDVPPDSWTHEMLTEGHARGLKDAAALVRRLYGRDSDPTIPDAILALLPKGDGSEK